MRSNFIALVLITTLLIAACGSVSAPGLPRIALEDAWVRAMPAMQMHQSTETSSGTGDHLGGNTSTAYMIVRNKGGSTDYLVGVQSEAAEAVEMHTTQTENGISTMRRVERIEVPAGGEAILQPGGFHIMLINLKRELSEGDMVTLTLEFEQSGIVEVDAEVRTP